MNLHWTRFCLLSVFGLVVIAAKAQEPERKIVEDAPAATGSVVVTVQDALGQPVAEAQVAVLRWSGVWNETSNHAVTDARGIATLSGLEIEQYLTVRVVAKGFATTMSDFEFVKPEQRELTLKLAPPASPVVKVLDPEGNPIAGAEIQRMEFVDGNQASVYMTRKTAKALLYEPQPSDEAGQLVVPPVPAGSRLTLSIVHPDWKAAAVKDLIAIGGEIASVTMKPGVRLRIELNPTDGVPESLHGLRANIKLFSSGKGTTEPLSIIHPFTVDNNRVDLTAYDVEYQQFSVEMQDYFVTPEFINVPSSPIEQLDLSSVKTRTMRLDVRPKVKATGRVVDRDGNPMEGVDLWGAISSVSDQWPEVDVTNEPPTNEEKIAKLRREWSSGGNSTTDRDGRYEILLAPGKAYLEAYHVGFFTQPHVLEFDVAGDGSTAVPAITLLPVPTLRGVVRDQQGRGIGGMVVRMRSLGRGDAEPVDATKSDGSFQLKMSRIPYRKDGGGLLSSVYVVAFDPDSDLAGIAEVAVADADATRNITVDLSPRSADWVLNPLQEIEDDEDPGVAALQQKRLQDRRRMLPDGLLGKSVPDLSEGTWLNTDARSLADFRGKYVLLDFWFIGCGPCHRDMPSIKMAHKMFSDQGFSVVSVHRKGHHPDSVRAFAKSNDMQYPIVVDDAQGTITEQYQALGVTGYPSYILLDPEGKILHNDNVTPPPTLRSYKIEKIYQALRENGLPSQ